MAARDVPESRKAAPVIALDAQGRILLLKYRRPTGDTFWATPGGGLQDGESFASAGVREAEEELGVKDARLEPLGEASACRIAGSACRVVPLMASYVRVRLHRGAHRRDEAEPSRGPLFGRLQGRGPLLRTTHAERFEPPCLEDALAGEPSGEHAGGQGKGEGLPGSTVARGRRTPPRRAQGGQAGCGKWESRTKRDAGARQASVNLFGRI